MHMGKVLALISIVGVGLVAAAIGVGALCLLRTDPRGSHGHGASTKKRRGKHGHQRIADDDELEGAEQFEGEEGDEYEQGEESEEGDVEGDVEEGAEKPGGSLSRVVPVSSCRGMD